MPSVLVGGESFQTELINSLIYYPENDLMKGWTKFVVKTTEELLFQVGDSAPS